MEFRLPIANEWYDDEYKQNHKFKPYYINNAINGIIPEYKEEYDIN